MGLSAFLGAQPNRGTSIPLCRETQWVIGIECSHEGLSVAKIGNIFQSCNSLRDFLSFSRAHENDW